MNRVKVANDELEIFNLVEKQEKKHDRSIFPALSDIYLAIAFPMYLIYALLTTEISRQRNGIIMVLIVVAVYWIIKWIKWTLAKIPTFKASRTKESVEFHGMGESGVSTLYFKDISEIRLRMEKKFYQDKMYENEYSTNYTVVNEGYDITWHIELICRTGNPYEIFVTHDETEATGVVRLLSAFLNRPIVDTIKNKVIQPEEEMTSSRFWEKMKSRNDFPCFPSEGSVKGLAVEVNPQMVTLTIRPEQFSLFQNPRFLQLLGKGGIGLFMLIILIPGIKAGYFSPISLLLLVIYLLMAAVSAIFLGMQESNPCTVLTFTPSSLNIVDAKGNCAEESDVPLETICDIKYDINPDPHVRISTDRDSYRVGGYLDIEGLKSLEQAMKASMFEVSRTPATPE